MQKTTFASCVRDERPVDVVLQIPGFLSATILYAHGDVRQSNFSALIREVVLSYTQPRIHVGGATYLTPRSNKLKTEIALLHPQQQAFSSIVLQKKQQVINARIIPRKSITMKKAEDLHDAENNWVCMEDRLIRIRVDANGRCVSQRPRLSGLVLV